MSGNPAPDKHEQARGLAEDALEALDEGVETRVDALIEGEEVGRSALREVMEELDDAASKAPQ